MSNCPVSLILATGKSGQVGIKNDLPWRLPEELKHFKELRTGHAIIMGRKTFESIGKPLPGSQNIVVSKKIGYLPGVTVVPSLEEALARVEEGRIGYVIGGIALWEEALERADSAMISLVDYDGEADVSIKESFFENLRQSFRLERLKAKDGFTITQWVRASK